MKNQKYYWQLRQVLCQIAEFLAEQSLDPLHQRVIDRALGKLRANFLDDLIFPAMLVPTMTWKALEQNESQQLYVLNASHYLFYAFLDLTDDVEDHELDDPLWRQLGEPIAINTGTSLLFASQLILQRLKIYAVSDLQIARLQMMFQLAGWKLTVGQHRDLASWRYSDLSPEEVLKTHSLKTGTSVCLYFESAAYLAGATAQQQQGFAELGQALGLMVQISGDWLNLQTSWSSDLANHCLNYPLAVLKTVLSASDQETYAVAWENSRRDHAAQEIIRYLLKKYQIEQNIHQELDRWRTQATEKITVLSESGCQMTAIEALLERFKIS